MSEPEGYLRLLLCLMQVHITSLSKWGSRTHLSCPWADAVDEFNWKISLALLLIEYSQVVYLKYDIFQAKFSFNL